MSSAVAKLPEINPESVIGFIKDAFSRLDEDGLLQELQKSEDDVARALAAATAANERLERAKQAHDLISGFVDLWQQVNARPLRASESADEAAAKSAGDRAPGASEAPSRPRRGRAAIRELIRD